MAMSSSVTGFRPKLWVAGDLNAFFGFGTNILVNVLVLTGLLRFVLKMPDQLVFGRILPATGLMLFLSTMYYAWLAYRLAKKEGRDQRLRAALGHQRAAHVRRHLRHHAADPDQDQGSDPGVGSGSDLGVHPELRADGGRLHRAVDAQDHAARRAARLPRRHLHHLHLDESGGADFFDAGDRRGVLRRDPRQLVRRRALFRRRARRPGRDPRRQRHRLGLEYLRHEFRRA